MSNLKKNTFFNILLGSSQLVLPLITFPYLSRVLGPEKIGTVNFIDSFVQNIVLVSGLGIPIYGVREIAKTRDNLAKQQKVFTELFVLHLLFAMAFLFLFLITIQLVPKLQVNRTLCYIGAFLIFSQAFLLEWYFQGIEKFKYISLRSISIRLVSVAIIFFLVNDESDYITYYIITVAIVALNAILNFYQLLSRNIFSFKDLSFKKHLKPIVYILSYNIAISVYIYLDNTFLGFLSTNTSVGFFSTALRICKVSLGIITALGVVIIPQLARAFYEKNSNKTQELVTKSFSFVVIISLPIVFFFFFEAKEIILFLAGSKFVAATTTLKILSPVVLLIGLNNLFGIQLLSTFGYEKLFFKCVLFGMVISIVSNLSLIPKLQHNGAALTTLITEFFVTAISYYYVYKNVKVTFQWVMLLTYAAICFICYGLTVYFCALLVMSDAIRIIAVLAISNLLYFLILIFVVKNAFLKSFISDASNTVRKRMPKEWTA